MVGTTRESLCGAVERGQPFNKGGDPKALVPIPAALIRRLVLGLADEGGAGTVLTPAGIEIHHARIEGRLELDRVIGPNGGPVAALELHNCYLTKGFSGAHGGFSRLSFTGCRFGDPDPAMTAGDFVPTIDLSGAVIERDLDMDEVAPEGGDPEAPLDPEIGPYLWIRLTGARIGGHLALSSAYLRAPVEPLGRGVSVAPIDALNLSLAEVGGDIWFLHSTGDGGVSGRGLTVKGDIWMSGAHLRRPGFRGALFLQAARIGGGLVLDGCDGKARDGGSFRQFVAKGPINLVGAQVSGFVIIADVDLVAGEADSSGDCVSLRMTGARIGNMVEIGTRRLEMSRLGGRLLFDRMEIKGNLQMENLRLGHSRPGAAGRPTINADGLVARAFTMCRVSPLCCGDLPRRWFDPEQESLSISLKDASLGTLEVRGCRFTGPFDASPIRCTDDVHLHGRIGGEVDLAGAEIGGSLDIAGLRMDSTAPYLSLKGGTIGHALRLARPRKPGARPPALRHARRVKLCCLPDTTLIETLWEYQDEDWRTLYRQSAFLERDGMYYLLDRRADILGDFVARHGHTVGDTQSAKEYFRLYCDYGPSELPCRLLSTGQLPSFAVAHKRQSAAVGRQAWPGNGIDDSCLAAPSGGSNALGSLGAIDFSFDCTEAGPLPRGRAFDIAARLICGDLLARGRFRLYIGDRHQIEVRSRSGPERAVRLDRLPVADGQRLEHPPVAGPTDQWVSPPWLETLPELESEECDRLEERLSRHLSSGFSMQNRIDLSNLTCTTLEDRAGRLWGSRARISMNHFTYRQAQWYPRNAEKKKSHLMLRDKFRALQAERLWPFRSGRRAERLRERDDYWEPWQIRRNWIYQQFSKLGEERSSEPNHISISRHRIDEQYYRPQPLEQAIRVARAEGREDFAIHFEMLKQRIEWRLFNRMVRWWLAFFGIALSALWLLINHPDEPPLLIGLGPTQWATIATLAVTMMLMIRASKIYSGIRKVFPWMSHPGHVLLTWLVFFIPAFILCLSTDWWDHPAHFIIGLLIFLVVRCISVIAYGLMRFGFGYLRRPVRAIGTLLVAFLVGWLGVHAANEHDMLVINAEPVAGLVRGQGEDGLVGIDRDVQGTRFAHNVPCIPTISEPLYALDVLIPLIDLREESRCEVRRVAGHSGAGIAPEARKPLGRMGMGELWNSLGERTLGDYRFWWLMKALYAIVGWFIVSLSILTFAQANRTHAEPPTERK